MAQSFFLKIFKPHGDFFSPFMFAFLFLVVQKHHVFQKLSYLKHSSGSFSLLNGESSITGRLCDTPQRTWEVKVDGQKPSGLPHAETLLQSQTLSALTHADINNGITEAAIAMTKQMVSTGMNFHFRQSLEHLNRAQHVLCVCSLSTTAIVISHK